MLYTVVFQHAWSQDSILVLAVNCNRLQTVLKCRSIKQTQWGIIKSHLYRFKKKKLSKNSRIRLDQSSGKLNENEKFSLIYSFSISLFMSVFIPEMMWISNIHFTVTLPCNGPKTNVNPPLADIKSSSLYFSAYKR